MRSKRKNRTDIKYKGAGGIPDLLDNLFKGVYYINDEEYDYICENMSDEEMDLFAAMETATFKEKREALIIVDKYIEEFNTKPKQR